MADLGHWIMKLLRRKAMRSMSVLVALCSLACLSRVAAQVPTNAASYDPWKSSLIIDQPSAGPTLSVQTANGKVSPVANGVMKGGGATCECWHEPDATYT